MTQTNKVGGGLELAIAFLSKGWIKNLPYKILSGRYSCGGLYHHSYSAFDALSCPRISFAPMESLG
jgi:hypothetical protein